MPQDELPLCCFLILRDSTSNLEPSFPPIDLLPLHALLLILPLLELRLLNREGGGGEGESGRIVAEKGKEFS